MRVFLAGGKTANLAPAYNRMLKDNDISVDGFIRALYNERFIKSGGGNMKVFLAGGERRHWLMAMGSNESVFSGGRTV